MASQEQTFTCFPNLPSELRIQIWKHAASVGGPPILTRITRTLHPTNPDYLTGKAPSILHVNREARYEAAKFIRRLKINVSSQFTGSGQSELHLFFHPGIHDLIIDYAPRTESQWNKLCACSTESNKDHDCECTAESCVGLKCRNHRWNQIQREPRFQDLFEGEAGKDIKRLVFAKSTGFVLDQTILGNGGVLTAEQTFVAKMEDLEAVALVEPEENDAFCNKFSVFLLDPTTNIWTELDRSDGRFRDHVRLAVVVV